MGSDHTSKELLELLWQEHSRDHALLVAHWILESADHRSAALEMLLHGQPRDRQRLAWGFGLASKQNPGFFQPVLDQLIAALPEAGHQAERRAIAGTLALKKAHLQKCDRLGDLAEICILWVPSPAYTIAVRAYLMEVMVKIARIYPELAREFLLTVTEIDLDSASPGIKSKVRKVKSALQKLDGSLD